MQQIFKLKKWLYYFIDYVYQNMPGLWHNMEQQEQNV